ncbi:MAG TPA: Holliday junction resolvase RuvX [Povalibacter sp.]|jgi:putative Holliday junction resolvase|nr:Holliday junction resolvase RuvX [Povalibacter sp.]
MTDPARGPSSAPQLILAFDFGTRRIGVASGDTLTSTARPLITLTVANGTHWREIDKLIADYRPARLIVGLPYNMDGTPTALTGPARQFARELLTRYAVSVALVDERLSSREAEAQLRDARAQGLKRRRLTHADVDMTAAKILLERWFDDPSAAEPLSIENT